MPTNKINSNVPPTLGAVIFIPYFFINLCQDIMGGGRMKMLPREAADPEYPEDSSKAGSRNDGRNLIGM